MLKWLPYPAVRASSAFALGIFMGLETTIDSAALEPWCLLMFVFFYRLLKTHHSGSGMWNMILALLAFAILIIAGIFRSQTCLNQPDTGVATADFFLATVKVPSYKKGRYLLTDLAITRIWSSGTDYQVDDHILWYQASSNPIQLSHGTQVVLRGTPAPIAPPQNPLEFDYAGFMARKNVFWSFWSRRDVLVAVLPGQHKLIQRWRFAARSQLQSHVETYLPEGTPQEIAMAMLLGDRLAVSGQLEEAFARSGTIHVLAVSGLHMGILYWLILQLIGSWRRHFLLKWLFVLLSLFALWAFALVSGAAASTQRAATMFSVMIVANALKKEGNSINTLAISALIILWADPYQLFSVGFQLSFLALGGILYLQPWIAGWLKPNNRVLNYLWQLISVSLAAQLAVLPLSAYYFHQLPVYFLIANIFLVPLSFGIVITGILFFACFMVPFLSPLTATPITQLARLAGFIVEAIADIPGSSIQDMQLDLVTLFIWYSVLGSGILFLRTRGRFSFLVFLSLFFLISLKSVFGQIQASVRQQIMIYQIPGHTAIDFVSGNHLYMLTDVDLIADPETLNYKVNSYRRYLRPQVEDHLIYPGTDDNPFALWMFRGKRLLLIKAPVDQTFRRNIKIKSHIVVVTENSLDHIRQLISRVDFELLLIDGSNSRGNANRLEEQALELGLEVHNCWKQGYKSINL